MRLLAPLVALLTVILISPIANAQVIQSCVKQNGSLRIVNDQSECRSNETSVPWNQAGEKGDKGDPGDDGEPGQEGPPGPGLLVFDGDGNTLGPLVDFGGGKVTFFREEIDAVMTIDRDGRVELSTQPLHFAEPNCQGPVAFANDTVLNSLVANGSAGVFRLFVAADGPPIVDFDRASFLNQEGTPCTNSAVQIPLVTEMIEVMNSLTLPLEDVPVNIRVGLGP